MAEHAHLRSRDYRLLQEIGKNISHYRTQIGLSQEALAEKVDVSRVHLARVESGMGAASLPLLFSISEALDIPIKLLFDFETGTADIYDAEDRRHA